MAFCVFGVLPQSAFVAPYYIEIFFNSLRQKIFPIRIKQGFKKRGGQGLVWYCGLWNGGGMGAEKILTNRIIRELNKMPGTWVYKRFASGNEAGKPDLTGISGGLRLEIEVKSPHRATKRIQELESRIKADKKLSPLALEALMQETLLLGSKLQRYNIKRFQRFGAITGVVTSLDQVLWLMAVKDRPVLD
jgi:hypothetical protein